MTYKIVVLTQAQKEALSLPRKDQKRITAGIASLSADPYRGKQLQGKLKGAWAIRVWPYRIIYTIETKIVTVTVIKIGHRKNIYQ